MRDAAPVHLEIRARGDEVHSVREEQAWPIPSVRWTQLHLAPGELRLTPLEANAEVRFEVPGDAATFVFRVPEDMELVGPMKLRLHIALADATDAYLFASICKRAGRREVPFEGPFGFGCDVVAKGWLRVAHRRVDESRSELHRPFHPSDRAEPLGRNEIAPVDIEILPSATFFARGDQLCLDVRGRWPWRRSMFFGMFPGSYAPSPSATVILHVGGAHDAHLLVPRTG
ncbi:MAG TPA: CocE/NonD family hydrolase C-terminal non-catalytic domain-containing protein [Polyangiaceae bacterium]